MHEQFLQQAIDLAVENVRSGEGGPYGAVIVKSGQLIAASANRVTRELDPTAHAEISAIRQACQKLNDFQLQGCILYASCEPCPMCLGAIYWARLEKVYFACTRNDAAAAGFDDSVIYDEMAAAPSKRRIAMLHVNLANAGLPFAVWAKSENKLPY